MNNNKIVSAMKQALEALELARTCIEIDSIDIEAEQAADALRQAIATEESSATQDPVGEAYLCDDCQTPFDGAFQCPACGNGRATKEPVYTHPQPKAEQEPKREPLTDDQIDEIIVDLTFGFTQKLGIARFARAIEAAHGIKGEA